jgi:uncharacterized membrane protein YfcA
MIMPNIAKCISAIIPTAVSGSITHYMQKTMILRCGIPLGIGSLIGGLQEIFHLIPFLSASFVAAGAFGCGEYVKRVDNETLQYLFCGLMAVLGARNFVHGMRLRLK